jgi:hypothetical protein
MRNRASTTRQTRAQRPEGQKNTPQLQTQENEIHRALKAWYLTPGIQGDLRNKENGAVQTVLEVLERRRAVAHQTVDPDKLSAGMRPR